MDRGETLAAGWTMLAKRSVVRRVRSRMELRRWKFEGLPMPSREELAEGVHGVTVSVAQLERRVASRVGGRSLVRTFLPALGPVLVCVPARKRTRVDSISTRARRVLALRLA